MITEIKKIIENKVYIVITVSLVLIVTVDFLCTCSLYKGAPMSMVPSAYDVTIMSSKGTVFHIVFGSFIFLLLSSVLSTNVIMEETENKADIYVFTRMKPSRHMFDQIMAIVMVTAATVFLCIIVSLILTLSAFPIQGHFTEVTSHNMVMTPSSNRLFSYTHNFYPYANIILIAALRGITAGAIAFVTASLIKLNRFASYIACLLPMFLYIVITLIREVVSSQVEDIRIYSMIETDILSVNGTGNNLVFVGYLSVMFLIGIIILYRGAKDNGTII